MRSTQQSITDLSRTELLDSSALLSREQKRILRPYRQVETPSNLGRFLGIPGLQVFKT